MSTMQARPIGAPAPSCARTQPDAGARFSALLTSPARTAMALRDDAGRRLAPTPGVETRWLGATAQLQRQADVGGVVTNAGPESPGMTAAPPLPAVGLSQDGAPMTVPNTSAAWQEEAHGKDSRAAAKTSMADDDDLAGLLDEVAKMVLRHSPVRAGSWSITVWLREAVLRDTQLTMAGEPGSIHIRFSTHDPNSLRRLHAGHDDLQAQLRERIQGPELHIAIEAMAQDTPDLRGDSGAI